MGGDSFPDTERLSEEEYVRTCQVISKCLREQDLEICIPVEVKDKAEICRVRGRENGERNYREGEREGGRKITKLG